MPNTSKSLLLSKVTLPNLKTLTDKVAEPKSIAPPVLFNTTAVTVLEAVTSAVTTRSVESTLKEAIAKSPNAAPVTVTSSASSSPSAMLPKSLVSEPVK